VAASTTTATPATTPPRPSLLEYLKLKVEEILSSRPELDLFSTGIVVATLDGRVLYSLNPRKPLVPASNMKLLTAAAALRYLGPDFRFRTLFLVDGEVVNGTLVGNLIVRGFGDPTVVSGDWAEVRVSRVGPLYEPEHLLDGVAEALAGLGIRRVSGDIVVDDYYLDHEWVHPSWAPGDLSYYYAAQVGALTINRNTVLVEVYASPTGSVRVRAVPDVGYVGVTFLGRVVGSSSEVRQRPTATRTLGTNEVTVTGDFVANSTYYLTVTVHDPGMYFGAVLRGTLRRYGIEVLGGVRRANTTGWSARVVYTMESRPLADIVKAMLKDSVNLYSELLMKVLGREVVGEGSWSGGARVILRLVDELGIDRSEVEVADGSGLSRLNRLSANAIARLLQVLYSNRYLYDALPIAGVDGTLRSRMQGTAAQGNLRAKTGTLTGVSALSGYVTTRDGVVLVFSMIFNGFSAPSSVVKRSVEDRIGVLLAELDTSQFST
jgi:PBP4 family serine-type D-alanyl-D-alanine carboxypeptidase